LERVEMGACQSCGGVAVSEEKSKDNAARVLQQAASGHLKKKEELAAKQKLKEKEDEEKAQQDKEAEAAKLLQRAAAAHLAQQEQPKPPSLDTSAANPVAQLIDTAREMLAGAFSGLKAETKKGEETASTGTTAAAEEAAPAKVTPPSLAIPADKPVDEKAGIDFIDSARFLLKKANETLLAVVGGEQGTATAPAAEAAHGLLRLSHR